VNEARPAPDEPPRWLDHRRNVDLLFRALVAVCVLLLLADFVVHPHGHFAWEEWPGFYSVFGFVAFFLLVLAGKYLRRFLMRPEDYYDR
jgi:drug/metabolite transporter (DMT)-like permease